MTGRSCAAAHSSLASSTVEAPSVSGVELPAVIVAVGPEPKTGRSVASFSSEESGRRVSSRVRPQERRHQVVEEAALVRGGEVAVAGRGELVLGLAGDAPLERR